MGYSPSARTDSTRLDSTRLGSTVAIASLFWLLPCVLFFSLLLLTSSALVVVLLVLVVVGAADIVYLVRGACLLSSLSSSRLPLFSLYSLTVGKHMTRLLLLLTLRPLVPHFSLPLLPVDLLNCNSGLLMQIF